MCYESRCLGLRNTLTDRAGGDAKPQKSSLCRAEPPCCARAAGNSSSGGRVGGGEGGEEEGRGAMKPLLCICLC